MWHVCFRVEHTLGTVTGNADCFRWCLVDESFLSQCYVKRNSGGWHAVGCLGQHCVFLWPTMRSINAVCVLVVVVVGVLCENCIVDAFFCIFIVVKMFF